MAFRFNFTGLDLDLDDVDVDDDAQGTSTESDVGGNTPAEFAPSSKFDVLSLAATLPHLLQADVVRIPLVADVMYKRSLTDVKFQAAQEDDLAANDGMPRVFELVEKSDLVKGVYEGGFKTWECSIDLVQYLATNIHDDFLAGKRALELGCGSSLPGIHLLHRSPTTTVDFQDYNEHVLSHVTVPNVIINTTCRPEAPVAFGEATAPVEADVELPEGRMREVLECVARRSRMFAGDWAGLVDILGRPANADRYDIILTSETIYSEDSIPRLIHVITNVLKKPSGVAYVAAKTIYFGVSGGTLPFRALVERARDADGHGLEIETVAEVTGTNTVKREVLRVRWRV